MSRHCLRGFRAGGFVVWQDAGTPVIVGTVAESSESRRYMQVVLRVGSPAVIFVLLSSRRYFS